MIRKLLICDVDATLIKEEGIDLLAKLAGSEKQVEIITKKAMNGEFDFTEALVERVSTLQGLNSECFNKVYGNMHFTDGAENFFHALRSNQTGDQWYLGLASGGFSPTVSRLAQIINADFWIANELEVENDRLTGRLQPDSQIVDSKAKLELLIAKTKEFAVDEQFTFAIGDGMNDLAMLMHAGHGFALNPKPKLREAVSEVSHIKVVESFDEILELINAV